MNMWIIVGIIAGVLLVGGLAIVNTVTANDEQNDENTIDCSTCGNSCTQQSNCGLKSCGAVNGAGSCGCGR